jgi:hypothetical protein
MKIAVAALHLALLLTLGAWAEATEIPAPTTWLYTYTGSPFAVVTGVYQPGDRITGSFAIRSDFDVSNMGADIDIRAGVLSYSFTDGHQTFTEDNSTALAFLTKRAVLDGIAPEHNQVQWDIVLSTPTGFLRTVDGTDRADIAFVGPGLDPANRGLNSDGTLDFVIDGVRFNTFAPPGTWTAQAVPEPTTLMLLSAGLAALAVRRYAGREYLPRFQWWAEEGSNL